MDWRSEEWDEVRAVEKDQVSFIFFQIGQQLWSNIPVKLFAFINQDGALWRVSVWNGFGPIPPTELISALTTSLPDIRVASANSPNYHSKILAQGMGTTDLLQPKGELIATQELALRVPLVDGERWMSG